MGAADSKPRQKTLKHPSYIDRPTVPGKPLLVPSDKHSAEPDVVTIRWEPPLYDGGSRITGYLVEHRRTGSPHWVRSSPGLVRVEELTLSGLEPGWRYQFRVSAQNAAGLSEPGELSDLLTVTLQRTAASAPFFVKELRNTVALENEKAELSVQVRGTPTPTVAWFKDGVEIFSSRSYRVITDNEVSTLVIHQAALSDEGEIKCSATNRVGYAVTRAKLVLEAPPSIRLPRQYEEGLLFEKDEVIRLKVSVAGRPVPEVSWLLNGEPVPGGGRYEASHSERYATLRVGEARRSDRGEYQVRAVNRLGEDVASFLVTVADRPMAPGRAKVVMTLGRSITLSWSTPEDDGGCKIGNYIVEYYRLGWNMWLKAATCRQLTTTLGELIEGSEYKFRVKAENPYGVSDPSPESDVVFIPDPKRGLLEPPEHGPADTEAAMDIWLEDKKRPISTSPTIDEQYGERKTKKKRGPMAPLQKPEPQPLTDKHSMMSEDSMSPPATPENFPPVVPKRRGKTGKDVKKDVQEEKELARQAEERRKVEEFKMFAEIREAEEKKKAEDFKKAEELKQQKKEEAKTKVDVRGPQSPRMERDRLHGSSEFMLVLLPNSRAATEERETSKRELFESSMALEGDVAPPMSLSAPELGSGDPPEMPPVRSAFSSTELLHERAMARFYQDMEQEEAETSIKRRSSLQRRRSFGSRTKDIPEVAGSLQDIVSSLKASAGKDEKSGKVPSPVENRESRPQTLDLPGSSGSRVHTGSKTFSRDSMDSVLSTEDPHRKSMLVQQASEEDMEYEDSSFDEDEEDEYDEEEEEPVTEDAIDEEIDEELEEEEIEDEFSNDEKRESLYTSESEEEIRSYSIEDTYHPRNVNLKYNEDTMISAYEGRGPLILGSAPQSLSPPSVTKQNKTLEASSPTTPTNEIKLKPILKRPSDKNETKNVEVLESDQTLAVPEEQKPKRMASPEKRFEPNFSPVMPKPILKVREPSQEKSSPVSQRRGVPLAGVEPELNLESSRTNLDELSDYETGVKKKQVRIEEPEDVVSKVVAEEKEPEKPPPAPVREELRIQRTGSIGEDVDATRVLISHYSDIVAEYGRGKRPRKPLYLNYEALKAAAEQEEEKVSKVPMIVVNEPEPTRKEKESIIGEKAPLEKEESVEEEESVEDEGSVKDEETSEIIELKEEGRPWWKFGVFSGTSKEEEQSPSPESQGSWWRFGARTETQNDEKDEENPPQEKKSWWIFGRRTESPKDEKALSTTQEKRSPSPSSSAVEEVEEVSSSRKSELYSRSPSPSLQQFTPTERKVHLFFDFMMDVSLFILACWLYLFKDERLSIPVLCLMIYRQAHEAFQRKMEALRNKIPRRVLFWRRQ